MKICSYCKNSMPECICEDRCDFCLNNESECRCGHDKDVYGNVPFNYQEWLREMENSDINTDS